MKFFACFYLGDFLFVGEGRDKDCRSIMRVLATHSSILAWRIPWTEESLVGYSPWGRKESEAIERLSLTHSLSI